MTATLPTALPPNATTPPNTTPEPTSAGLSVAQGAALSIGAVLGTGVIALPAFGAQIAGPASLVAWAALVLLSIPLATTFAALGARYPDAGGVSTYVRRAFGARPAAVVGWSFYLAVPVGAPAAGLFAGAYVAAAIGGGKATVLATTGVLMLIVTLTNAWGVRVSGRLQLVFAGLLVTLLVAATLTALPHADLANLTPFAPHGWWAIAPAAAVLVWGFVGWEAVTSLAGEMRDPSRNVPRVTAVALTVVSVLYLAVAGTSLLVLGPATGATEAPLAELLAVGLGERGAGRHRGRRGAAHPGHHERLLRRRRPSWGRRWAATVRCPAGSPRAAAPARCRGGVCSSSPASARWRSRSSR